MSASGQKRPVSSLAAQLLLSAEAVSKLIVLCHVRGLIVSTDWFLGEKSGIERIFSLGERSYARIVAIIFRVPTKLITRFKL